jgi:opacity protein-like surface antigen
VGTIKRAWILTVILIALATPAAAQSLGPYIYISPTVGVWRWDEKPAAFTTIEDQTAFMWGGRVGYSPIDAFSMELVGLTGTNEGTIQVGSDSEVKTLRLTQVEFSILVNFQSIVTHKVYPFLDLGVGGSFRSGGTQVDGESVFDDTQFTFHIGGGLKVELNPRAALRFNIRDTFFSQTQGTEGNQETQVTVDSVELSVGLDYRFPIGSGSTNRLR